MLSLPFFGVQIKGRKSIPGYMLFVRRVSVATYTINSFAIIRKSQLNQTSLGHQSSTLLNCTSFAYRRVKIPHCKLTRLPFRGGGRGEQHSRFYTPIAAICENWQVCPLLRLRFSPAILIVATCDQNRRYLTYQISAIKIRRQVASIA